MHGYTLVGVALHLAVLALLAALAVAVKNALFDGPKTPPPKLLVHADTIRNAGAAASAAAVTFVERGNALLTWTDSAASTRWTAAVWLAARASFLLAPTILLTVWVAAFVAAPLYEFQGRAVDAFIFERVFPLVFSAQVRGGARLDAARRTTIMLTSLRRTPHLQVLVKSGKATAAKFFAENRAVAMAGASASALAIVYVLWGAMPLTTVATGASRSAAAIVASLLSPSHPPPTVAAVAIVAVDAIDNAGAKPAEHRE